MSYSLGGFNGTGEDTNDNNGDKDLAARGERLHYGGELAWFLEPAALKFKYDVQTNEREGLGSGGSNLDDVTATGWYVSGTYVITGEEKLRSGNVVARRPFTP